MKHAFLFRSIATKKAALIGVFGKILNNYAGKATLKKANNFGKKLAKEKYIEVKDEL